MRIVRGLEDARQVLCEGRGLGLDDVPQSLLEGIADLFGEALTPMQVVERIVRRVRAEGDAAVREYSVSAGWRCARRSSRCRRSAIAEGREGRRLPMWLRRWRLRLRGFTAFTKRA